MISPNIQYTPVAQETDGSFEDEPKGPPRRRRWETIAFAAVVMISILGLSVVFHTAILKTSCSRPALRREWRTLSTAEQTEYLRAVKCLHHLPSGLGIGGKLSDDFPWLHFNVGSYGKYSSL